jgi:hypothetical protein
VVAIGAALEGRHGSPLDLYPHPPTLAERAAVLVSGPMRFATASVAVAAIALIWAGIQVFSFASADREAAHLRETIATESPTIAPMRSIAQRRSDLLAQVGFVRDGTADRSSLTQTLAAIGASASDGISFDTLNVQHAADGWAATIEGTARGATTTQAVYGLDALLRSIRAQHAVATASLDDFDYPKSAADSLARTGGPVMIAFHLSFAVRHRAEAAR